MRPEDARLPPLWRTSGGRIRLAPLVSGFLLLSLLLWPALRSEPPTPQPVAFNHLYHTQDLGLGCEFCHQYVRSGAHAGLPGAQTCQPCHQTSRDTSEEATKVTRLLEEGDPLQFNKLFRLPDYAFYTHRRHVGIAKLECSTCHGGIADTERPPEHPLVDIKMKFCRECHEERGVTQDCNACHR